MIQAAYQVEELCDAAGLEAWTPAWRRLLAETPGANLFQTPQWLSAFWRHQGGQGRLRVLAVSEAGEPLGIVPLAIQREDSRLGSLRVLTWPMREWGPMYGPVGPRPAETLAAALAHLRRGPRDWDLLDLRSVPVSGWNDGLLAAAMRNAGLPAIREPWSHVPLVDLTGDWEAYLASRSRHVRKNLRRAERKLAEQGEVRYVRHRPAGREAGDADPRWELYDDCVAVAGQSWQGRATDGNTLSHDEVRAFLREVHGIAVEGGAVDVNLLYVAGRPVAFAYNYVWQRRVSGLRMGFDAGVSRDGAGSVLLASLIQDSFARADHSIDLGAGYIDCKRPWYTSLAATERYTYYPPAVLRAQALRLKRAAAARWRRLVGQGRR